jgi:hypothetical protein
MSFSGVILILSASPRVGKDIGSKFASNGYSVAPATHSLLDGVSPEGYRTIKADLSNLNAVPLIFQAVEMSLGLLNVFFFKYSLSLIFNAGTNP